MAYFILGSLVVVVVTTENFSVYTRVAVISAGYKDILCSFTDVITLCVASDTCV